MCAAHSTAVIIEKHSISNTVLELFCVAFLGVFVNKHRLVCSVLFFAIGFTSSAYDVSFKFVETVATAALARLVRSVSISSVLIKFPRIHTSASGTSPVHYLIG